MESVEVNGGRALRGDPRGRVNEGAWESSGRGSGERGRESFLVLCSVSHLSRFPSSVFQELLLALSASLPTRPLSSPFRLDQPGIVRREPPDQDLRDPAPSCLSYATLAILS